MWKRKHRFPTDTAASRGFTLVEVMMASALSLMILAAVFATFLFLAKSSFRLGQYTDMETEARRALHQFSQDARQADQASWTTENALTLTTGSTSITYAYNAAAKTFSRAENGADPVTLARGISTFSFKAYQRTGAEVPLSTSPATAGAATKMIQI